MDFWSDEVIQRFGCFDFLDPLQSACGILRLRANLCSEVHNPALKFRMVGEFSQMHLRGRITRNCHVTLSTSPNTRSMVSHRLETIVVVQTFFPLLFPKSKVKVLVAMIFHFHFSQCLLFYESPMMLPNFLIHYVIPQALVGQLDNQKRFREYSYPLAYFAALSIRG